MREAEERRKKRREREKSIRMENNINNSYKTCVFRNREWNAVEQNKKQIHQSIIMMLLWISKEERKKRFQREISLLCGYTQENSKQIILYTIHFLPAVASPFHPELIHFFWPQLNFALLRAIFGWNLRFTKWKEEKNWVDDAKKKPIASLFEIWKNGPFPLLLQPTTKNLYKNSHSHLAEKKLLENGMKCEEKCVILMWHCT